jgi:hypothetical protein
VNGSYVRLAERIRQELVDIRQTADRALTIWSETLGLHPDYGADAVAFNLHNLYSGLERLFLMIAKDVDRGEPHGPNWHQELLRQMSSEVPGVRGPVLSQATRDRLEVFRGFRHIVRNVYTYNPKLIQGLVEQLEEVAESTTTELRRFADNLTEIGQTTSGGADSGGKQ